jgi:hypothetical protein
MEIPKIPISTVVSLAVVVGIIYGYEKIKNAFSSTATAAAFATAHPNLAALAISLGFKTPGGSVPDTTGAAGSKEAAVSQAAAEGSAAAEGITTEGSAYTSEAFYDACLQDYAFDNNFETSLAAQGTSGWTWKTYSAWVAAGYPTLPHAEYVSVDTNGVFHNQYE